MNRHPTGAQGAIDATAAITGQRVDSAHPVGGGYRVELADGRRVLAKRHEHASAVLAEVAGLEWLAATATVAVPRVPGHDDRWLVIDWIEPGRPTARAAEEFGRGLAGLHAAGAPSVGAAPPHGPAEAWIGHAPMRNQPGTDWPQWYAEHRVVPYLRTAVDRGLLDPSGAAPITEVCDRIQELAGPAEQPARLHGDLWQGNVHWAADGQVWLIDPAAHGGHRETDLAMLGLFGCPQLDRILAGYQQAWPLADGWRDRVPLHQLFPLLVHTVLFGGGYAEQAASAARAALRG